MENIQNRTKESKLALDVDAVILKRKTQKLIYHSQKGLCVSEAYFGYLKGHPVHHEYAEARQA